MNFVFGIPSYKRAEKQTTLSFLNRLGYSRDEIFISNGQIMKAINVLRN